MAFILIVCGATATTIAVHRSFVLAREALGRIVHDGEPTRAAIEHARPIHARPRVRHVAGRVGGSVSWLVVAMYGLFLLASAAELPPG